jgi:hypothetical protein
MDYIRRNYGRNYNPAAVAITGGSMAGVNLSDISETIKAHGNTGTTAQEIDLEDGSYHTMTVTGAFTLSFTNWPSGKVGSVIVKFVNGSAHVITWPAAIAGTDPVLQASGTDFIAFWTDDDGTTIYYSQLSIT